MGRGSDPVADAPADAGEQEDAREEREDEKQQKDARPHAPPTSRLGRLARLASLAPRAIPVATEALRKAVKAAPRDADAEREAQKKLLENAQKTADAMLKTLGEMKGLPLKFGQMASYIDGLAPPGYEEKFQLALKKLQAKAPPLSREAAHKVVSKELGAPEEVFAEWEAEPFAAASIGQVHRATTKDGTRVAVKVQYPGIDKAIENDLKSISLLETMIAPIGRKYHSKDAIDEIKEVFLSELDYRTEAERAQLFARIHDGDDDIVIPRVAHPYTTKRVLTCELLGGADYAHFIENASQEERNAASRTIWRFMFKPLFVHGVLYADPHPGNYRFLGGGRIGFLDFGCVKIIPKDLVDGMKRYMVAAADENWDEFYRACVDVLGYDPEDEEGFRLYTEYTKFLLRPITHDGTYKHTREAAKESVAFLVRGTKKLMRKKDANQVLPTLPKPIHVPRDFTFINRLQWGLASVMAGIGGEDNWREMTAPWLRGPTLSPP
jgi:predicted unusual protein kinase regulating ubiquinone biosynthesis (AarF/ABC1/UbiB family)